MSKNYAFSSKLSQKPLVKVIFLKYSEIREQVHGTRLFMSVNALAASLEFNQPSIDKIQEGDGDGFTTQMLPLPLDGSAASPVLAYDGVLDTIDKVLDVTSRYFITISKFAVGASVGIFFLTRKASTDTCNTATDEGTWNVLPHATLITGGTFVVGVIASCVKSVISSLRAQDDDSMSHVHVDKENSTHGGAHGQKFKRGSGRHVPILDTEIYVTVAGQQEEH